MKRPLSTSLVLGICLAALAGCSDVGYYVHCASGHLELMSRTRDIEDVINDPRTGQAERDKLVKVLEIRTFASAELGLPENGSYRRYADIGRPYVVWNVVAAPEFSLQPKQWCFPVAGCVSYRGYFKQGAADAYGDGLTGEGYDVDVYGVQAYSTLKWFDDPVLNTFLAGGDSRLAALIFHELAHQVVYVPGDSAFNEAFAKTVELEGLRRWLRKTASETEWQASLAREQRSEQFQALLKEVRDELDLLYQAPLADSEKRAAKQEALARAMARYQDLRAAWPEGAGFDAWMARGLNNARLASVATYRELVPAFQALLSRHHGNLAAFYSAVADLGRLSSAERLARLRSFEQDHRFAQLDQAHDGG